MPADTALLLRSADGDTRISMLGMKFPLDLVWFDDGCRVVHIVERAPSRPWPLFHSSPHPARGVLELLAGQAEQYGLDVRGSKLEWCAR
jgi:uncharacterized membrane protein (UPF0127 family)